MANSAEVGKLRLTMEADTAQLEQSVDDVQSRLDRFATRMGITAAVVEKAMDLMIEAVTSAVGAVIDGFVNARKAAADLDSMSQRVGIGAARLSELKFAAEATGTPVTLLAQGLQKLSVVLQNVGAGDVKGPAARALDALGVSATDSNGKVREMSSVLEDLAAKFASYRDGAQKTALATMLFGESGARLIPFLNQGSEGLARLTEEARALGLVLDERTTSAAAALEDELVKLDKAQGVLYQQISAQVTPALLVLTTALLDSKKGYGEVSGAAQLAADGINMFARLILALDNLVRGLSIELSGLAEVMGKVGSLDFEGAAASFEEMSRRVQTEAERAAGVVAKFWAAAGGPPSGPNADQVQRGGKRDMGDFGDGEKPDAPRAQGSKELADAQRVANEELQRGNQLWREGTALINEMRTPMEIYHAQLEKIATLQKANAISAEQAARAQAKAANVLSNAYASAAGSIVGDLGKVFENNKAVAIAAALINTYQAVTNAWANVPWPLNIAAAGAALAAGMAQVQNIRSTNKGGGGGGGGAGGGGGGSASAGPTQAPQMISLSLAPGRYSRDDVRGLIEQINEAVSDGAVVRVA